MDTPKSGEVWKVKVFHRTYWSQATIRLVDTNPHRPGFGWLFHRKVGGHHWSESTECRFSDHVRFIARLEA